MSNLDKDNFENYLKELLEVDYSNETHEKIKKIEDLLAKEISNATAEMMALKQMELDIAVASRSPLDVSRIELIDEGGRQYMNSKASDVILNLKEKGNVLKIFVNSKD